MSKQAQERLDEITVSIVVSIIITYIATTIEVVFLRSTVTMVNLFVENILYGLLSTFIARSLFETFHNNKNKSSLKKNFIYYMSLIIVNIAIIVLVKGLSVAYANAVVITAMILYIVTMIYFSVNSIINFIKFLKR